jgi:colicin import membrane protein
MQTHSRSFFIPLSISVAVRTACSLWLALVIVIAAAPVLAQSADSASGQPSAEKTPEGATPAGAKAAPTPPRKQRTEAEKAAARARSEAEQKRRQQAAIEQQSKAYLAQVSSLGLSEEQTSKVAALPAEQAAWQKANAAEIQGIRERMITARADSDMQTVKTLTEQLQKVMKTRPDLDDVLTPEQFERMNAEAVAKIRAAHPPMPGGTAGKPPAAAAGAPKNAPEVEAIHAQIKAARQAGDTATVEQLQTQLRMLKDAVRKKRADDAAAQKKPAAEAAEKKPVAE